MADMHIMTAPAIADLLGITARRVRQYATDGLLPAIERGKFDVGFLLNLRIGEKIKANTRTRPDRDTLVAIGWLSGVDTEPSPDDIDAFARLFERNGLRRDAALLALGRAQGAK